MKSVTILTVSLLISVLGTGFAKPVKQVAITIDDLPFVGTTNSHPAKLRRERERFLKIMNILLEKQAPAVGFVIAGSIEKDQWQLLEAFHENGLVIGNHTYSHPSLNSTSAENYIRDIERADRILAPLMNGQKYFRYPYLAESRGQKRQQVREYLYEQGYQVAPVTIDSKDFRFNNQLYRIPYRQRPARLAGLKKRYLNYIWRQTLRAERISAKNGEPNKQILLIHANLINSHAIGDIIDMYRQNGYTIVSLDEVMPREEKNAPEEYRRQRYDNYLAPMAAKR